MRTLLALFSIALISCTNLGCQSTPCDNVTCVPDVPRELSMVTHPPYTIAAPDILLIDAIRVVPIPPYKLSPLDTVSINVPKALPDQPLQGIFPIDPDGTVNLGPTYGKVSLVDKTVEEAREVLEKHMKDVVGLTDSKVTVALAQFRGMQQIKGDHLVRPDGTVGLGLYGSVYVAGLTLEQAKLAIETHLTKYLQKPEISVDIFSYNSKVFYVITDGGGFGEQVYPIPSTGNETVLDALGKIGGLPAVASKRRIWVARPAPSGHGPDQTLAVNWEAIAMGANTTTNYQVLPGDRVYVMAEPLITADTLLARFLAPWERIMGFSLLGNSVVRGLSGQNQGGFNNGGF
ncbi:MAG: polysaccharide biosynthesis/export family protein [Planctomycetia bacterium]|nr:polysaccharide biosynthesis/export family protein [Planctomycetia bacterium]